MSPESFCFWLQGFFEITRAGKEPTEITLDATQVEMIEKHLALVFAKVTGAREQPGMSAQEIQEAMKRLQEERVTVPPFETTCSSPPFWDANTRKFC